MGFDVLSFVMGQQAGKASGGSSNIILFEKQTVTGFETNASYQGAFTTAIQPRPFAITVGGEYIVEWDGTEYKVTGQDTSSLLNGTASIGNGTGFGFSGNNEPFFLIDWGSYMTFVAADTETSHTVKIYQEAISPTTVELDFSDGDMEISAGEGKAFSKVDIPKPETLIPKNIAKDVSIAGIVGTLSAGGSSDSSYKHDTFKVTAGQMTVEHGGGAVPDLIIVALNAVPGNGEVFFSFGFSEAMLSKLGGGYINSVTMASGGSSVSASSNTGIEGSGSTYYARYGGVRNVTATTFEIGNSKYTPGGQLQSDSSYSWYAFYGLA